MLPEASVEGNIPTKGEQHACYMAEHLTIDLLYHYHMDNMYTCNIHSTCKRGLVSAKFTRFSGPFIMEFIGIFVTKYAVATCKCTTRGTTSAKLEDC